jgi:hypothetical protein
MTFQDLSYTNDCEFMHHAINISETLSYLTYLLCIDAEEPERVRLYAQQVQERVRALGSLLRSSGCEGCLDLSQTR